MFFSVLFPPSNKGNIVNLSITRPEPTMLYPFSRQYPFDEVGTQIVQALEERNWEIPGIIVEFRAYGSGEALYRYITKISGKDFTLEFGRAQGVHRHDNNIAAISRVAYPKRDISVYEDESGPTFAEYIGDNWEADREQFLRYGRKFDSKDDMYVSFRATPRHNTRRSPNLAERNGGFRRYKTDDVYNDATVWLIENVLRVIEAQPTVQPDYSRFNVADIPLPSNLSPLYTFGGYGDAVRIRQGQTDRTELYGRDRYALKPSYRWVTLSSHDEENPITEAAYDGYVWCAFGEVTSESTFEEMDIPGYPRWNEKFIYRVTLNRANNVYVGDQGAFEQRQNELFASAKAAGRDRLTDAEMNEMYVARGHMFVPITEYDGSFTNPVVLVGRELGFDEVELVSTAKKGWEKKAWEELG